MIRCAADASVIHDYMLHAEGNNLQSEIRNPKSNFIAS